MSKQGEPFRPEGVDEQIETFSHEQPEEKTFSSGAHLISNLRLIYQEEGEVVEQVWARLVERAAEKHRPLSEQRVMESWSRQKMRTDQQKGHKTTKTLSKQNIPRKKYVHVLEMIAAVIVVTVLVGSMVILLQKRRTAQTSVVTPAQTRTAATTDASGFYISTTNGIDKVSLQTGQVLWHVALDNAGQPFVIGNIVFFRHGDSRDYFLEAVNATTGKQLWRKNYGASNILLQAHGILYDSTYLVTANDGTVEGFLYAIKPADGTLLWSFPTLLSAWMTIQDNVVYGTSFTHLFALNATTGKPLWQKTLSYPHQEIAQTPLVLNHVLYTASCNPASPPMGYSGCYLLAFNATNGVEIWHTPVNGYAPTEPVSADGVLYYGPNDYRTNNHPVYAVNAKSGAITWTYTACTGDCSVAGLSVVQSVLYIQTDELQGSTLLALDSAHRHLLWSKALSPYRSMSIMAQGLIYVLAAQGHIEALNASSGAVVKSYADASETIMGFSLVTQNG